MQEAQALRRQVMVKDKEAAERATLVKQEKLQRHANRSPLRLVDVWVFPTLSQKRKTPGTLECHYNGFRCAPHAVPRASLHQHATGRCTVWAVCIACGGLRGFRMGLWF